MTTTGLVFFFVILTILFVTYLPFIPDFLWFLLDQLFQAAILVLLFILIYGQAGQSLGLPLLFWSEEPVTRLFVASSATLVLAVIALNGYYLIPEEDFHPLMAKVFGFLGEPYPEVNWQDSPDRERMSRRIPAEGAGPLVSGYRRVVAWASWFLFLDFLTWFLGPRRPQDVNQVAYTNTYRLSRFLLLVRLPFLTLLMLPALLPGFFIMLPRFAPLVKDIQARTFHESLGIQDPDVVNSLPAYLYALATWSVGIWLAVVLVRLIMWVSFFFQKRGARPKKSVAVYGTAAAAIFALMASVPLYDGNWFREHRGLFGRSFITGYDGVAPGVAILALLAGLALLNGMLRYFVRSRRARLVAVVLVLVVIAFSNSAPDSFRFEGMDYSRPTGQPGVAFRNDLRQRTDVVYLPDRAEREKVIGQAADARAPEAGCDPLLLDEPTLEAWKKKCRGSLGSPGGKPKLVVVCTSGGAIRSGYWTATVLDRLGEEIPCAPPFSGDFHSHVRLITGASGGMVGASYYVTWLRDREALRALADKVEPLPEKGWIDRIPIFGLRAVARFVALRASLLTVGRRLVNAFGYYPDRGRELESDWPHLRYPLSRLRVLEGQGKLPSMIFSPMTIEDGRRLLISNLDLGYTYDPKVPPIPSPAGLLPMIRSSLIDVRFPPSALGPVSLTGLEFFKAVCPTERNDILVSTAARMSATFPYVSPAVYLPSEPPLRVVDAGYYDNYGVDLASAWIYENRRWILGNTSGVVIVQIRDALSLRDRLGYPAVDEGIYARLFRGLQFFSSPVDAVLSARSASSAFRNDALIAGLSEYFSEQTKNRSFLTTIIFELASQTVQPVLGLIKEWPGDGLDAKIAYADSSQSTEVSMSWYLTVAERQAIDQAIPRIEFDARFKENRENTPSGAGTEGPKLAAILGLPASEDLKIPAINPGDPDQRKARVDRIKAVMRAVREGLKDDTTLRNRALYVLDKEVARASNYERLRDLGAWWRGDHSKPEVP